jgi:hypothetical protein
VKVQVPVPAVTFRVTAVRLPAWGGVRAKAGGSSSQGDVEKGWRVAHSIAAAAQHSLQ